MKKKHFVITITRQFGSLGREIGKRLAESLDINYYDRDLLEHTAEQMGMEVGTLSKYDESTEGKFSRMLHPLGRGQSSTHKKVFNFQKSMILNIAAHESCVIIGRCADYILKDDPDAIHFFIYAPYPARLKNSEVELGLSTSYAAKMIEEVDEARSRYHKFYTGEDFDSIKGRHVCIDSSLMSMDNTVMILKKIVEKHFGL